MLSSYSREFISVKINTKQTPNINFNSILDDFHRNSRGQIVASSAISVKNGQVSITNQLNGIQAMVYRDVSQYYLDRIHFFICSTMERACSRQNRL